MVASFRKSSSLPPYVHMVEGKGGCTFSTEKCLLLVVIWQFFLCGFNFSCSWRHCIQISQIRVWSARIDAPSDNWVLPIIKYPPVWCFFIIVRHNLRPYPTQRIKSTKLTHDFQRLDMFCKWFVLVCTSLLYGVALMQSFMSLILHSIRCFPSLHKEKTALLL